MFNTGTIRDTTPPRLLRLIVPIKTINAVHYNNCLGTTINAKEIIAMLSKTKKQLFGEVRCATKVRCAKR